MKTITIDIINDKVLNILNELELLKLIRLRKKNDEKNAPVNWQKYKGAMTKESPESIENQVKEIRSEWE